MWRRPGGGCIKSPPGWAGLGCPRCPNSPPSAPAILPHSELRRPAAAPVLHRYEYAAQRGARLLVLLTDSAGAAPVRIKHLGAPGRAAGKEEDVAREEAVRYVQGALARQQGKARGAAAAAAGLRVAMGPAVSCVSFALPAPS